MVDGLVAGGRGKEGYVKEDGRLLLQFRCI